MGNVSSVEKTVLEIVSYYYDKELNKEKTKLLENFLANKNDISDDEIILLGCILYDTSEVGLAPLHGKVCEFYESLNFYKENVDSICEILTSLKKDKLSNIEYKKDFIFAVDSLYWDLPSDFKPKNESEKSFARRSKSYPQYKSNSVPEKFNVPNTLSFNNDYKTKETAFKYLYSAFYKNYHRNHANNALLPTIIFQSVFHKLGKLLKIVNVDFGLIKQDSLSDADSSAVRHIKKKETQIYKDSDKDAFICFNDFKLNGCFFYKKYGSRKSLYYGLDAIEWFDYFVEVFNLLFENKVIVGKQGELLGINYVAFLCLSDIFDLIFINDKHLVGSFNKCDFEDDSFFNSGVSSKKDALEKDAAYRFPAFTWNLFHIYGDAREGFLIKKDIYNFLLDFIGITQAREKLKK